VDDYGYNPLTWNEIIFVAWWTFVILAVLAVLFLIIWSRHDDKRTKREAEKIDAERKLFESKIKSDLAEAGIALGEYDKLDIDAEVLWIDCGLADVGLSLEEIEDKWVVFATYANGDQLRVNKNDLDNLREQMIDAGAAYMSRLRNPPSQ
jgi:hypothetical protein